ncbi:MAG TPA: hypothetical protein VLI94_00300 [Solirubrobacterales bacterium]|nr:hypothetical protein [Solirubrobacterales bacterium]
MVCLGLFAPLAAAAEFPYTLDEELSLTGDCSTSTADAVPDPDCQGEPPAYPPPPDRPAARFDLPFSVTVDDWGNVYVASRSSAGTEGRIDIFDSEGHFISELEDPHGPRSIAVDGEGNLYAYEFSFAEGASPEIVRYPPDVYNPAAGEIEYDPADRTPIISVLAGHRGLAIDRADPADAGDDRLYVNEEFQIGIYSSAATGNALVDTIEPPGMDGGKYVAVDAERRRLYTTTCKNINQNCVVWAMEADAPYDLLQEIDGNRTPAKDFFSKEGKLSIAVDETNGHFFIGDLAPQDDIFEFDASYDYVSRFTIPGGPLGWEAQSDVAENPKAPDPADLNPADNYRHLYVPLSRNSGSAIAYSPPEVEDPEIESIEATDIGETEAELSALIHPHQLETTYEIRYVSEAQHAIDGFSLATLAASGTIAGLPAPQRVSALIGGLQPGTAYRVLVTAENELGKVEEESSFTTHDDAPASEGGCPNELLRTGVSAVLPDCRAYELVTPPDTAARVPRGDERAGEYFGMLQASPSGEAVDFLVTTGALPGTEASGYFFGDPYLATRGAGGWSTALAGPTGAQASKPKPGGFSPDQGYSFWLANGEGSALIGGEQSSYVRYPDGHSELIGRGSLGTDQFAKGLLITEGGTHIIFRTHDPEGHAPQKLEPEAPEEGIIAIYDRTRDPLTGAEETHVVSLLPDNTAPSQNAEYRGASADGEAIAFRLGTSLYLRVANETTYEIGAPGATFAGVSDGGERAFYLEGGDLKAFDTGSEEVITFADTAEPVTPVNVAPQGGRAYFVSETAVPGSGPNPGGDSPLPGAQNLYLSEGEGTPDFIATLTERDVEGDLAEEGGDGLGFWIESLRQRRPSMDPSRLTPDGGVLVFQSRAELDGFQPGVEPQVYRYDHLAASLECVSCPPTGTPATGGAVLQTVGYDNFDTPLGIYGFVPALRADGKRLFFESTEALRSSDTDGLRDVYEWEAEGVGSCKREGGCVYLISSGRSARPDYLFGHSQSGDDVFIHTSDVLLPGDEQTASIYDARVGGGFASSAPVICAEEACKPGLTPPPALPAPQTGVQGKSGNVKNGKSCPRGKRKVKRKGKVVCVKKHKKQKTQKTRKAGARKGAGR